MSVSMSSAEPEAEETQYNLVSKRSSTSVIWDYFGFDITDVQQKKVLCKTCRGTVASRHNPIPRQHYKPPYHLKNQHLYDECMVKARESQSCSTDVMMFLARLVNRKR